VLRRCRGQVRAGLGGPFALDFVACLALAAAQGAPMDLFAEILPHVEPAIVAGWKEED
jgi:hypothetical protein